MGLLIIYKSFIRPHLDYGYVNYDQTSKAPFFNKNELLQCNRALAVVGAIKGSSRDKLYRRLT